MKIFKIIINLLFLTSTTLHAQDWKEMMYDPSYNFYEVCDAAKEYFKTHDKDVKGSGWMGYQRWRDENESKYYPSGDRSNVDPAFARKAYEQFIKENPSQKGLYNNGWKEVGPTTIDSLTGHYSVGLGRIEDFYVDPTNMNRMYMGSRSGGLWRTIDGGTTWSTGLTDFLVASGVNAVTARPGLATDVLINVQNAGNQYSHGIYKSSDAGDNWVVTNFIPTNLGYGGLGSNFRVYDIEYHPTIPNLVFVGTSKGVFRSSDDLATWTQLMSTSSIRQIKFHPTDANIIYAYDANSGSRDYVKVSIDGGLSWNNSAQASGNANSSGLIATSTLCPDCIYLQSSNGIWKSVDKGASFTFISNPAEGKGAFIVNDQDTTQMLLGSIDPFVSSNGGASFGQSAWWSLGSSQHGAGSKHEKFFQTTKYVHADLRAGASINGVYYLGTDGFLCKSIDNGANWTILNHNTGVRENYTLGISQSNHYVTMIGSQDNGTSLKNQEGWIEFYGADGMEAIVHPLNPDWMIGSFQYGGRRRTLDGGMNQISVSPTNETGSGNAAWVAPLAYDPFNPMNVYHFSGEVYRASNFADLGWVQQGVPSTFGGNQIEQAAFSENNPNVLVVSRKQYIERSTDAGQTYTDIRGGAPNYLPSYDIKDIAVDPKNDSTIVVVFNRYQNDTKKVYITWDAGQNWTNISYNLNDMPIRSVVIDHSDSSYIYLGGEIGVYVKSMNDTIWELYNTNLPNMTVRELEINYGSNTIRAATWGRGMWEYTLKDRGDYPAILTTSINNPPTLTEPKEDIDQYVTSMISYNSNLTSVYTEWSINQPTFGDAIPMSNTQDSTWRTDWAIPNFPVGTKMFFRVIAVGSNGDTTETYKFMYEVRYNVEAGLVEHNDLQLDLFPNPNDGEFTLKFDRVYDEVTISIVGLDGKVNFRESYNDVSSISEMIEANAGTYFVVVGVEGRSIVRKMVLR